MSTRTHSASYNVRLPHAMAQALDEACEYHRNRNGRYACYGLIVQT
jgi:hypothetical protein